MTAPETPEEQPDTAEAESPNREAAKYRRALRETETERDTLRGRVESMQRAEVERLARDEHRLAKPDAVWSAGTELAALLDDDGNIDPEKVRAATENAVETLGLALRPTAPRPDPSQGPRGGGEATVSDWSTFLSRKEDRP